MYLYLLGNVSIKSVSSDDAALWNQYRKRGLYALLVRKIIYATKRLQQAHSYLSKIQEALVFCLRAGEADLARKKAASSGC